MPRPYLTVLIGAVFLAAQVSLKSDITVTWDDGFETFTDFGGTALSEGATGNENGDLVILGFYSEADDSNLFQGTWIPLTSTTSIGDSSDLSDLGDGFFSFTANFDSDDPPADGDAAVYFGESGAYTNSSSAIRSIEVTSGGSGYDSAPTVSFSGGGGSGAEAIAVIDSGAVSKIVITNPGSGYTSLPTVSLSGGTPDSAATASADYLPQAGQLLAIRYYDGTSTASGTLFNTIAATSSNWNDWPTSDVDPNTPNLSVDTSNNSFLTDAHSLSYDLKTAVTDIDSGLSVSTFQGALYLTENYDGGTLTADTSGGNQSFTGIIADGDFEDASHGKLALDVTGSNTLTLSGSANTFTGDTTLTSGNLTLTGSATISNSDNIVLASGTTLTVSGLTSTFTVASGQTLKGEGAISGDTDIADGGIISPGDFADTYSVEEISITGAGTWNQGMTYHWEITDFNGDAGDANDDGLGWDHMSYSGALTINGSAGNKILIDIAAIDGFNSPYNQLGSLAGTQRPAANRTHTSGHQWAIVTAGSISGFDADHFEIDYTNFYEQWDDPFHQWSIIQSGNSLYLTYSAVPEPSTYVMVSGLLLLPAITFYRRWKKKKSPEPTTEEEPTKQTETL